MDSILVLQLILKGCVRRGKREEGEGRREGIGKTINIDISRGSKFIVRSTN